ncbi:MAG TPA: DNA alkylation repair protein [Gemmataceae bacterium]|nr:DNA alkylation repair protein [Gemmataceae bacterium]
MIRFAEAQAGIPVSAFQVAVMVGKRRIVIARVAQEIEAQIAVAEDRSVPTLRTLRRATNQRLRAFQAADVVELAFELLSSAGVPRWFVYEVVQHHRQALVGLTEAQVQRLGRGLSSWDEVDTFACFIAGPAWREGQIRAQTIHRWAISADRWWRRAAVVSTVALNNTARGGRGDAARTLAVCAIVMSDKDDMVVKALSWALRELARKKPEAVRRFLRSNDGCLAARVVREVNNKLETGLKNPRSGARRARKASRPS